MFILFLLKSVSTTQGNSKASDTVYNIISPVYARSTDSCLINRRKKDADVVSSTGIKETEIINLVYIIRCFQFNTK